MQNLNNLAASAASVIVYPINDEKQPGEAR